MFQGKQIADNSIAPSKIIGGVGQPPSRVNFTFATPSPMTVAAIAPSKLVYLAQFVIIVPFNDPAATIEFGLASNPSLFLGPSDSRAGVIGQYQSTAALGPSVPDFLLLTINPAASTQGSGFLLYSEA